MGTLLEPEERVLATLNADGSRRWITPRLAKGALWKRRRIVGYALIALFVSLPFVRIGGKPALLLNVIDREFVFGGTTFYPTDTLLLGLLLMTIFVSIFFLTALFGRVWCGWACPQTVYLELVFRPIDRLLGTGGYTRSPLSRLPASVRKALRTLVFVVLSFALANVFLAYFVGTERLGEWVLGSPLSHPMGFGIVMLVTAGMLFDFGFFREQLCTVACPYGRMQSVMLDTGSLIVGYDARRGEPRGRKKKARTSDVSLKVLPGQPEPVAEQELGDCVACTMCVQVCPTGIDIRDGLQLECIHCTQCIDACNDVMLKVGRPTGLIRYSSQSGLEGKPTKRLRARVIIYPGILLVLLTALFTVSMSKGGYSAELLRAAGLPYNVLPSGEVANQARVRITNRSPEARTYTLSAETVQLRSEPLIVGPGETLSEKFLILADRSLFATGSRVEVTLMLEDDLGEQRTLRHSLLGPAGAPQGTP